jgi:hypothetical protein
MLFRHISEFRRSHFSCFSRLSFISIAALTLILFLVSFNKLGIFSLDSAYEELNDMKEFDIQELNKCLPAGQAGMFTIKENMETPLDDKKVSDYSETHTQNKELEILQKPSVTLFFVSFDKLRTNPFDRFLNEDLNDIEGLYTQRQHIRMLTPDKNMIEPLDDWTEKSYYHETYIPNKTLEQLPKYSVLQQYNIYKEDQLLSNPGGDNFFLNKDSGVIDDDYDHSKFSRRVGKDLADAGDNLLNAMRDMGIGAKIRYVDNRGEIKEERKVGFIKTLGNFFKNIASGLTLGAYTPEGEVKPHGAAGRTKHLFKKVFRDAIVSNIAMGVPRSMIYVGEDILLAGLNSIEVIPDATIGNFEAGRKATTTIFDNTQVVLDFATDAMPGGEASIRTRSFELAKGLKGLPIINNITAGKNEAIELNWRYVRNTNFRKVIETVTSLIPVKI